MEPAPKKLGRLRPLKGGIGKQQYFRENKFVSPLCLNVLKDSWDVSTKKLNPCGDPF